jgi:glycosyltransferase involved in cell wall biosynthesis
LVENHALGCFSQGLLARKDFLTMGISESKIADLFYTTTPMSKTDEIPSNLKNFTFKYKFIYVGKLCERKGIADLLIAFSALTDKADWGLVLLGQDSSDGIYQKLASELNIDTKVLFAGVVQESSINQYHSHCDVFILPSHFDGWGAVINEAASMGMPIIGSDQAGASHHLIKNNENGYIFSAGDTKGLANAMQNYVSNPEIINSHGEVSLQVYRNFTPEKNVERFINALSIWTKRDPL